MLVKCYRCSAQYAPGGWYSGFVVSCGTANRKVAPTAKIPDDHCPMCRKPPQLEPTPEKRAM